MYVCMCTSIYLWMHVTWENTFYEKKILHGKIISDHELLSESLRASVLEVFEGQISVKYCCKAPCKL